MPASVLLITEAHKAVQMHEQGYSQPQIAQAIGRSRKAIRTGLRQMGVAPRSPAEGYRLWLKLRGGVGNRKHINKDTT
jgi:biotin operon repressor